MTLQNLVFELGSWLPYIWKVDTRDNLTRRERVVVQNSSSVQHHDRVKYCYSVVPFEIMLLKSPPTRRGDEVKGGCMYR